MRFPRVTRETARDLQLAHGLVTLILVPVQGPKCKVDVCGLWIESQSLVEATARSWASERKSLLQAAAKENCNKDFSIEVGTVHASGLSCLLDNPMLQRVDCLEARLAANAARRDEGSKVPTISILNYYVVPH